MKKVKKILFYSLGAFLAFLFKYQESLAQFTSLDSMEAQELYGVSPGLDLTLWEKIISVILSPFFFVITTVLALIVGIIIYIKRKRKATKKDSPSQS